MRWRAARARAVRVTDALEVGHSQRVVADRPAVVQGDLRGGVELPVGGLVEDRVVALVADPREAGQGGVPQGAGQPQVVQPRQVHGRPAAPDDHQGVVGPLRVPPKCVVPANTGSMTGDRERSSSARTNPVLPSRSISIPDRRAWHGLEYSL
jgi:hypothetical protein